MIEALRGNRGNFNPYDCLSTSAFTVILNDKVVKKCPRSVGEKQIPVLTIPDLTNTKKCFFNLMS